MSLTTGAIKYSMILGSQRTQGKIEINLGWSVCEALQSFCVRASSEHCKEVRKSISHCGYSSVGRQYYFDEYLTKIGRVISYGVCT